MSDRPLRFIRLHQKKDAFYIEVESIRQIHKGTKGYGAYIVTDMEGTEVSVDEKPDDIVAFLTELEIDVDLFANDDEGDASDVAGA